ncbi:MAG: peptidylprolyl isomerase [Clostridiales Family XIII bacterium]|jgi:peptidyl-prolyl cis-trans isomerase C|nr:peptidylprolyl isomerase [Clostridiales Family XIII bacterium]
MNGIKKSLICALCLLVIAAFSLSACGSKGDVAAKVNDAEITQDLLEGVAAFAMYYINGQTTEGLSEQELTVWENQVLIYLCVETEMLRQHFKDEGKEIIDADAKTEIDEAADSFMTSAGITETDLPGLGFTRSDMKYFLEGNKYYEAYNTEVAEADPITDEEAQAYYDANPTYFTTPFSVSASHILITDADHTDENRAKIEDILAKAKAGEDFAELAAEYSDDSSAASGGDLGSFGAGEMVPEFEEAAFALEAGEISDVVETEFGYHIIKLTDRQEESVQPFDEAKESIVNYLQGQRASENIESVLKEEFTIEYLIEVDPTTGEPPITLDQLAALGGTSGDGDGSGAS